MQEILEEVQFLLQVERVHQEMWRAIPEITVVLNQDTLAVHRQIESLQETLMNPQEVDIADLEIVIQHLLEHILLHQEAVQGLFDLQVHLQEVAQVHIDHPAHLQEVVLDQYDHLVHQEAVQDQLGRLQAEALEVADRLAGLHLQEVAQVLVVLKEATNCNTQLKENEKIHTHTKFNLLFSYI